MEALKRSRRPAPIITLRPRRLIAFGYYGGKFSHLNWLLPPGRV